MLNCKTSILPVGFTCMYLSRQILTLSDLNIQTGCKCMPFQAKEEAAFS